MRVEFRLDETLATTRREVIVIGAGVVGMATALTLVDRGHRVMVIDSAPEPGRGTSFANGAQLSYAYTDALASPSTLAQFPGLLLSRNPAFRFSPRLDLDFMRWTLAFLRNGSAGRFRRNTLEGLVLAAQSRLALHALVHRHAIDFAHDKPGKIIIYRSTKGFAAAQTLLADKMAAGAEQAILDADRAVAIEPALESIRSSIVGAIHTAGEEVGDPHRFCTGAQAALARGGGFSSLYDTVIDRIDASGRRPAVLIARGQRIEADQIVLCAGMGSVSLAQGVGVRLPVMPMKGYSITARPGEEAPRVSITDSANRVVFARLGDKMRIAGLADLGRRDTAIEPSRLAALVSSARAALPGAADYDRIDSSWTGLRPMTPDSLPITRPIAPGVIANTGHGALGWTYAAGSAKRVAAIIETGS